MREILTNADVRSRLEELCDVNGLDKARKAREVYYEVERLRLALETAETNEEKLHETNERLALDLVDAEDDRADLAEMYQATEVAYEAVCAARDAHWREVESLRERKDKLEAKVDEITALVDEWRSGRAHLGTPATFVDQRLLDGILKTGVSVSGQRGGTVTFSHWSGAATKPDEEHGAGCECCKGDGYYGVADGDGDVDTIICESLASQRDSWHKEAEAWKQTAANLQTRADGFEFLRELLVAVVKTGTKDPLLDARLAEELRSHE